MGVDSSRMGHVGAERSGAPARARAERQPAALLEPAPGGPAERFAQRVGPVNPVRVFLAAVLGGWALIVAGMVALGLLLTEVLLRIGGFASWDNHLNVWLASRRTPFLVDASWAGSTLAGGLVIPLVVGSLVLAFVVMRRWRLAAFTLFVICIESGAYRATSLVVHRDRPPVHRLEGLPVEASYPSGHTAASLALYGGLLVLLASRIVDGRVRAVLWALVVLIPVFVAWSRMERGMHHLTDTLAALLMGLAALAVAVFAARAAGAAAAARETSGS